MLRTEDSSGDNLILSSPSPFIVYRAYCRFLTQGALAQAAGLSRSIISRIEAGIAGPVSNETIEKLARALQTAPEIIRQSIVLQVIGATELERVRLQVERTFTRASWDLLARDEQDRYDLKARRKSLKIRPEELEDRRKVRLAAPLTHDQVCERACDPEFSAADVVTVKRHNLRALKGHKTRLTRVKVLNEYEWLKLGPTQEEVAARCDLSVAAYRNLEQGISCPQPYTLQRLACAFDFDNTYNIHAILLGMRYRRESDCAKAVEGVQKLREAAERSKAGRESLISHAASSRPCSVQEQIGKSGE